MNLMQAEPDSFLLTGTSHFIEPRILQNRIKKYSRECGIKDIHFHVLRHTFVTRCVEVGFEIKSLSEVLGIHLRELPWRNTFTPLSNSKDKI